MKGLSRRAFLRGVGGVAVGLPFLELMGCGKGGAPVEAGLAAGARALDGFPRRLVVVFSANGTVPTNWRCAGGESDFTFSPILKPLEPFRSKLLVLEGVDMESSNHGPGDGHQKGMGHMLTGTELLEGDTFTGGNGELVGWGGGISIDQRVAGAIGGTTKFKSLELGVQVRGASIWSRMCYQGADKPIPPEDDPYVAFDRIFGELGADPLGVARRRAQRRSVLDAVAGDHDRLLARLGSEDRAKLEQHLTAVRDIEMRLDAGGELGGACQKLALPAKFDVNANDNYPTVGRLQMDLLAMALACDLTRVATLQWSSSVSNTVFSWLPEPIPEGHHDLSHFGDSDAGAVDKLTRINTWYAEQLAYLLGKLDAVPEGDGTLLDHTVVLWCNELGKGNSHTRMDGPWLLAGSAGGHFRTGRTLRFAGGTTPHNNLLVSLQQAFGVDSSSFGNPAYCTGPLAGLV